MNINLHVFRSVFGKALLASAALGGFLLFAGAPGAKANGWDDCNSARLVHRISLQPGGRALRAIQFRGSPLGSRTPRSVCKM